MKCSMTTTLLLLLALPACTTDKDDTDTNAASTGTDATTGGATEVTTSDSSSGTSAADTTAADTTAADTTAADTGTGDTSTGDPTTGSVSGMRFADEVWPILEVKCGCHQAAASGTLFMGADAATAYAALVNMPSTINMNYVTPGDPDTSYMFHKISGTQMDAGGGGSKMPLGDMLTPEQIATISAWIVDGAD